MEKDGERNAGSDTNVNESDKPGTGDERVYFAHGTPADEIVDELVAMRDRMLDRIEAKKKAAGKIETRPAREFT